AALRTSKVPRCLGDRSRKLRRKDVEVAGLPRRHAEQRERRPADDDGLEPQIEICEVQVEGFDGRSRQHGSCGYRINRYQGCAGGWATSSPATDGAVLAVLATMDRPRLIAWDAPSSRSISAPKDIPIPRSRLQVRG